MRGFGFRSLGFCGTNAQGGQRVSWGGMTNASPWILKCELCLLLLLLLHAAAEICSAAQTWGTGSWKDVGTGETKWGKKPRVESFSEAQK